MATTRLGLYGGPRAALSSATALLADDVESTSEVSSPTLGQVHSLLADDVESTSEVSSPVLTEGNHILLADDVESQSEVTSPVITQVHALLATSVESTSEVSLPTVDRVPEIAKPTGGRSKRKSRKRYVVEVDGEFFEVSSIAEAESVLAQVRELAEESAERIVTTEIVKKPPRIAVKTISGKTTASKTLKREVKRTQAVINQAFIRAAKAIAQNREIADLIIRKADQEDEDDTLIALLM